MVRRSVLVLVVALAVSAPAAVSAQSQTCSAAGNVPGVGIANVCFGVISSIIYLENGDVAIGFAGPTPDPPSCTLNRTAPAAISSLGSFVLKASYPSHNRVVAGAQAALMAGRQFGMVVRAGAGGECEIVRPYNF